MLLKKCGVLLRQHFGSKDPLERARCNTFIGEMGDEMWEEDVLTIKFGYWAGRTVDVIRR